MIIKLTVKDNDFTALIETFCENLFEKLCFNTRDYDDPTELYQALKASDEIRRIIFDDEPKNLTDEVKTILKAKVFLEWCTFLDTLDKPESTKEYLKKEFRCSFSYTFKDRWENGENVYYFTHGQKFLTQ